MMVSVAPSSPKANVMLTLGRYFLSSGPPSSRSTGWMSDRLGRSSWTATLSRISS
jgi:hypothetical protein